MQGMSNRNGQDVMEQEGEENGGTKPMSTLLDENNTNVITQGPDIYISIHLPPDYICHLKRINQYIIVLHIVRNKFSIYIRL